MYHICNCPHPCQLMTWGFTMCMTCITHFVLRCSSVCNRPNMLVHVVHTDAKLCRCTMAHLTRNSTGFSSWKYGNFLLYFPYESLMRIRLCMSWHTWSEILLNFVTKIRWNAIDMKLDYRASNMVIEISLVRDDWFLLEEGGFFPTKKPISLGSINELSLCSIITTNDMFGRSLWCCCKHKKLIWRSCTILKNIN